MEIKLHVEDGLLNTDMMQALAGATSAIAAATAVKFEVKTITATGSVTAAQTPLSATGADKFVFKSTDGITIGSAISYTAVATANTYQMTGTRFSFDPTGSGMATGDTILIQYEWTSSAAARTILFDADEFSSYYSLYAETLFRDDSDGLDYPGIITADKVKLSDSFSLNGQNSGEASVFSFDITCLKPSSTSTILQMQILHGDSES